MRAKPLRGALLAQVVPVKKGREGWSGRKRSWARHNWRSIGSLSTNWTDGDGPETCAGAGGDGLPRYDGLERNENGDCEMVGATSCDVSPGECRLGPEVCRPLECWPATSGWRQVCVIWPGCGTCCDLCSS